MITNLLTKIRFYLFYGQSNTLLLIKQATFLVLLIMGLGMLVLFFELSPMMAGVVNSLIFVVGFFLGIRCAMLMFPWLTFDHMVKSEVKKES